MHGEGRDPRAARDRKALLLATEAVRLRAGREERGQTVVLRIGSDPPGVDVEAAMASAAEAAAVAATRELAVAAAAALTIRSGVVKLEPAPKRKRRSG